MANWDRSRESGAIKYSMLIILSVFLLEVTLGLAVGSLAILSDGFHALLDFTSMLILYISIRISSRPPDEDHMYGHEKFEYLGGMISGIILIVLALLIAFEAASKIVAWEPYVRVDLSPIGYAALAYTLSMDLTRILILGPRIRGEAPALKAAFYHALSDLSSTVVALLGFWLSTRGIFYGDSLASMVLSASLVLLSARFVWSNIMELSDVAPREAVARVKEEMERVSGGLITYENLRVRRVGGKFFVRATLKFPDYMRFEEAHSIATKIEEGISRALGRADVSLHIEPSSYAGEPTREMIRRIAGGVEGVMDAHDIGVTRHDGKTYISLHIRVDPKKPLGEAHRISEEVERTIHASIGDVGGVFVHVEPSNIEPSRGSAISDQEVNEVVESAIREVGGKVRVKRIVTYVAEGVRHVNIECTVGGDISVEEAHREALEIEDRIRRRLSETVVTVHMEPGGA